MPPLKLLCPPQVLQPSPFLRNSQSEPAALLRSIRNKVQQHTGPRPRQSAARGEGRGVSD
jgi:hypothetical protein